MEAREAAPTDVASESRDRAERLPLERLEAEICELAGHLAAAEARWLALVAEFDRREGWARWECRSCAHWLSWHCAIDVRTAQDRVRVARALPELPAIADEFANGRLSYSQVRAITRVATAATETTWIEWAHSATAGQLERIVRGYRRVQRQEAAEEENAAVNERHERRHASWYWDDDGSLVVEARLSPEDGAVVLKMLEAYAPSERSAERSPGVRGADALVAGADAALQTTESNPGGGGRYQVVIHADVAALASGGEGELAIANGPALIPETARRLGCDASVVTITERDGLPLDVGRTRRTPPAALRRALERRDRTCQFPGCDETRRLQAHHLRHWIDGGKTCLWNLVLLCRFHHRAVHEGGYWLQGEPGNDLRFTRRDGRVMVARTVELDPANDVFAHNERAALAIEARTITPRWYGDAVDLQACIDSLLWRGQAGRDELAARRMV
jgi:hypothetical protein